MAIKEYDAYGESAFDLVEQATTTLTRAVHTGVDNREYFIAKRALMALEYLHPASRRPPYKAD